LVFLIGAIEGSAQELHTSDGQILFASPLRIADGTIVFVKDGQELRVPIDEVKSYAYSRPLQIRTGEGEKVLGFLSIVDGRASVQSRFGKIILKSSLATQFTETGADLRIAQVYGKGPDAPGTEKNERREQNISAPASSKNDNPSPASDPNKPEADYSSVRQQGVLLTARGYSLDAGVSYLRTSRSLQNDTALVTNFQLSKGITPRLEGFASLPVLATMRESQIGPTDPITQYNNGIGDFRLGLKYLLRSNQDIFSQTVLSGYIQAPTGRDPYGPLNQSSSNLFANLPSNISVLGLSPADLDRLQSIANQIIGQGTQVADPRDPLTMQLGLGHWAGNIGLTTIQTYDPVVVFYGGDVTFFRRAEKFGYTVQPGTRFGLTGGVSFLVTDISSFTGQVLLAHQQQWHLNGQPIILSATSPVAIRLAYTHKLSRNELIEPSISYGLTGDTTSAVVTLNYSRKF
jgi:hypothetical protein